MPRAIQYAAIIPAAGKGSRLAPLPSSKELLPVGYEYNKGRKKQPKPISSYLIDRFRQADVTDIHIVLRQGKLDIIDSYKSGNDRGVDISYHITETEAGVPFSVDQAFRFYKHKNIIFGFPDILFYPENAFTQIIKSLNDHPEIELLLGLFPVTDHYKWDTVVLAKNGQIKKVRIKETNDENVKYAWILAAWRPAFSDFLHNKVAGFKTAPENIRKEVYFGNVIQYAIEEGLNVYGYPLENGSCLDVGTPEGLRKAGQFIEHYGL